MYKSKSASPKVSVIIPVYNVEKYLEECLESVLTQDFNDFELLLVDDGSKDSSGEICDRYAKKDSRIRVFHKPNGGVSSARNFGLDNARGEWVAFVDSDDTVARDYLSSMLKHTPNPDTDMVQLGVRRVGWPRIEAYKDIPNIGIKSPSEYIDLLLSYHVDSGPYSKLFKLSNINKTHKNKRIRFKEGLRIGEDLLFVLTYVAENGSSVYFDLKPVYNYRYVETSAMHHSDTTDAMLALNDAVEEFAYCHKEQIPEEWLAWFKAVNIFNSFVNLRKTPNQDIFNSFRSLILPPVNDWRKRVFQYSSVVKHGKLLSDLFLRCWYVCGDARQIVLKLQQRRQLGAGTVK